jgi:peptide/nickel transport system ATP-binding protein
MATRPRSPPSTPASAPIVRAAAAATRSIELTEPTPLLEVEGLVTEFTTEAGSVRACDGVSFRIPAGRAVALVGESGSGKSVTALSLLRLVRDPPGRITAGTIRFRSRNLLELTEKEMRAIRGDEIAMIFQEPLTALNPVYTAGDQVAEVLVLHRRMRRKEAVTKAVELFRRVGITDPERRVDEYPHQLSGGMRQRVMIAMALACSPALLIADEPTTALDVTIQAQILELLGELRHSTGMSLLLITHDLGIVAQTCDEVVVMYAGQVVEQAPCAELFRGPRHPYTRGLVDSVPALAPPRAPGAGAGSVDGKEPAPRGRLREIPGMVPQLDKLPRGCRFQDRCTFVTDECRASAPELVVEPGDAGVARAVRCFHPLGPTTEPVPS